MRILIDVLSFVFVQAPLAFIRAAWAGLFVFVICFFESIVNDDEAGERGPK